MIWIFCEGTKTEPFYFKALKRERRVQGMRVVDCGGETEPTQVVQQALDALKGGSQEEDMPDEVWCVFDTETPAERKSIPEAKEMAQTHQVRLAISNPAFEYWLVLHHAAIGRSFSCANDVTSELRKYSPKYDKSNSRCLQEFMGHVDTALENAKKMKKISTTPWNECPNPSTDVDLLVKSILEIA